MGTGPPAPTLGRVEVQAEWALKSKEATDVGYRLLNSSREVLAADNFEAVIGRFSPGTLETLPQVAISWLEDKSGHPEHAGGAPAGRSYVGIAVHDQPSRAMADASGRGFVETSYYCVDFRILRERNISYGSMYEGFKDIDLHGRPHGYIKTSLSVAQLRPPEYSLTYQAAGLLLTNKSVCILGADGATIDQRLRFIDEVASLLPYGMRSRLSASTWTSSTYRTHNFRLFFSSVERNADDHQIVWGDTLASTGLAKVDAYIRWLVKSPALRVPHLATERQETGFASDQVDAMLTELGVHYRKPSASVVRLPEPPSPHVATQIAPETAQHLLNEITSRLASRQPEQVGRFIPRLRKLISGDLTAQDRERYQQIVDQHKLLREDLQINHNVRADLYRTLLRLAYRVPVNCATYCAIERSLGNDQPIHEPLAQAIFEVGASEAVQLLVRGSLGARQFSDLLRKKELGPKRLVGIITHPNLQENHRRSLCEVALRYLEERPQRFDPGELDAAFRR